MARVVVIGSGAREHALVRALRSGARAETREVIAIPGNAGIAREVRCVQPQGTGLEALADAALAESPDLVVVGPEGPLAEGFADRMAAERVACFGPSRAAARIESSKAFAKDVMRSAGVPTPEAQVFDDPDAARTHARCELLRADPADPAAWLRAAVASVDAVLGPARSPADSYLRRGQTAR